MSNVTAMPTPSRPAPLVPADCALSGHDWFPLHGDRIRKSKWWRRASDLARARNVMLWWEAWGSAPAGSLPDDDDELAEAAGFGLDTETFLAHKDEIMAPWVLCADGRWYHPTVCEMVLEAWERLSERRKSGAQRQANYRARARQKDAEAAADPAAIRAETEARYEALLMVGRSRTPREGLHKHRILPGHAGGTYVADNVALLTREEHAEVHRIRYALFGDPHDRSAVALLDACDAKTKTGDGKNEAGDGERVKSDASLPRIDKTDKTDIVLTDSSSGDADDAGDGGFPIEPAEKPPDPVQQAFEAYNRAARDLGLPQARALTETRRRSLKARLKDHGLDGWRQALDEVKRCPFLQGREGNWAGADLDFLLQAKSFQRVIEGYYSRGGRATERVGFV